MSITKVNADVLDLTDGYAFTGAVTGAGKFIQVVHVADTAAASGTTTQVADDSIPQNTEGNEYLTLAITPTNASNILFIEFIGFFNQSSATNTMVALFQDSTANALAATVARIDTANAPLVIPMRYRMVAGTTSETTFKIRAGGANTTMTITEIAG